MLSLLLETTVLETPQNSIAHPQDTTEILRPKTNINFFWSPLEIPVTISSTAWKFHHQLPTPSPLVFFCVIAQLASYIQQIFDDMVEIKAAS